MAQYKYIIDVNDLIAYKGLPTTSANERLELYIREAHDLDLQPLLGVAFMTKIRKEYPTDADIVKLVEGDTYLDSSGNELLYNGLKMVALEFAFARFVNRHQETVTSHSVVRKINEFSEPVSDQRIAAHVQDARGNAIEYWKQTVEYLNNNVTIYPMWQTSCDSKSVSGAVRLNAIGGRRRRIPCGTSGRINNDGYVDNNYIDNNYTI